jgi:hypothetical protein
MKANQGKARKRKETEKLLSTKDGLVKGAFPRWICESEEASLVKEQRDENRLN